MVVRLVVSVLCCLAFTCGELPSAVCQLVDWNSRDDYETRRRAEEEDHWKWRDQNTLNADVTKAKADLDLAKAGRVNLKAIEREKERRHQTFRGGVLITPPHGKSFYAFCSGEEKKSAIADRERSLRSAQDAARTGPILNAGLAQGRSGTFVRPLTIVQVITGKECLVGVPIGSPSRGKTELCLLRGVNTESWTDDKTVDVDGTYTVSGKYSYQAANGAKRTVPVVEPEDQARDRKAK
jgi:hypothetical protein